MGGGGENWLLGLIPFPNIAIIFAKTSRGSMIGLAGDNHLSVDLWTALSAMASSGLLVRLWTELVLSVLERC